MIEAFYIILITLFGGMGILTVVTSSIRANAFRDDLFKVRDNISELERRIHDLRVDLQNNEFNSNLVDEEMRVLETQKARLMEIEEENRQHELSEESEEN